MTALAAALPYISAAGTIVSTIGAIQQGNAAKAEASFQAKQMEQQAGQERAASQRTAIAERRKAKIAGSRLRAVAAAGSGDTLDPTVVNLAGDIETQGKYNAGMALYNGEERARGLQFGADTKRYEGKQAQKAGYLKAATTLASGATSLMEKYSPTGGPMSDSQHDAIVEELDFDSQLEELF